MSLRKSIKLFFSRSSLSYCLHTWFVLEHDLHLLVLSDRWMGIYFALNVTSFGKEAIYLSVKHTVDLIWMFLEKTLLLSSIIANIFSALAGYRLDYADFLPSIYYSFRHFGGTKYSYFCLVHFCLTCRRLPWRNS